MESSMTDIAKNFEIIKERVDASAKKTRRNRSDITIVAVSKTVGADAVGQAVEAGIRDFGENYVKEYLKKREVLPDTLRWHIIGPLQSNKIKLILDGICLLHSLDRLSLAQEIEKQCEKNGTELSALVQLNIGKEPTKSGILEEDLERFLNDVSVMRRIRLKGLMAIPPAAIKADANRPYFEKMRTLFDLYKREYPEFEYLSMGMSDDFEAAIEEGSNVVRIGTAVFGARSN
jgi:pyridoxal phosphate enzyme (YggS family)